MIRYDWDAAKNTSNLRKHLIDFVTAILVFEDPTHIAYVERIEDDEERWHAIGSISGDVIVVVVHTYHTEQSEEIIRIVSARKATKHERKLYAKQAQ